MTRAQWTQDRAERLQMLIAQGLSTAAIAEALGNGLEEEQIRRYCARMGWSLKAGRQDKYKRGEEVVVRVQLPPPSQAMLHLAQFDPVIARAVAIRLGRQEDGDL